MFTFLRLNQLLPEITVYLLLKLRTHVPEYETQEDVSFLSDSAAINAKNKMNPGIQLDTSELLN